MKNFNVYGKKLTVAVLATSALVAGSAFADGSAIDVSGPLGVLAAVVTAAASIGVAYLGMVFGIRAYKWIKTAA